MNEAEILRRRLRWLTWVVIVGLLFGGVTAIPLRLELNWVVNVLPPSIGDNFGIGAWLTRIRDGLNVTDAQFPFIAYGTDWLAFAHFVIAFAFRWPLKDPVRYSGLFTFGLWSSVAIIPFALLMGQVRGIPWGWRLIDCSFGIAGFFPFWFCRQYARRLEGLGGTAKIE